MFSNSKTDQSVMDGSLRSMTRPSEAERSPAGNRHGRATEAMLFLDVEPHLLSPFTIAAWSLWLLSPMLTTFRRCGASS